MNSVYIVIYHDTFGNMCIEELFDSAVKAEKYIEENQPHYKGDYELIERRVR